MSKKLPTTPEDLVEKIVRSIEATGEGITYNAVEIAVRCTLHSANERMLECPNIDAAAYKYAATELHALMPKVKP